MTVETAAGVLLRERRGHVEILTINRPEKRNALTLEIFAQMATAWEEINADPDVWVAIVTGAGDRAFSAGADLKSMIPMLASEPVDAVEIPPTLQYGLEVRPPIIAALNGSAYAGGFEFALACDLRVAARSAKFALTEVRWGLFPGTAVVHLPHMVGLGNALELLLTADVIDAERALQLGLVNRVVDDGTTLEASLELAERICRNGPLAVQAAKRSVRRGLRGSEAEAFAASWAEREKIMGSADAQEGLRAFAERRDPVYRGQ